MSEALKKYSRIIKNSNDFDERLNNYSFILQKLQRNLEHIIPNDKKE
jgi:hypothetical protein